MREGYLESVGHHLSSAEKLVEVDSVLVVVLLVDFVEGQLKQFWLENDQRWNVQKLLNKNMVRCKNRNFFLLIANKDFFVTRKSDY